MDVFYLGLATFPPVCYATEMKIYDEWAPPVGKPNFLGDGRTISLLWLMNGRRRPGLNAPGFLCHWSGLQLGSWAIPGERWKEKERWMRREKIEKNSRWSIDTYHPCILNTHWGGDFAQGGPPKQRQKKKQKGKKRKRRKKKLTKFIFVSSEKYKDVGSEKRFPLHGPQK